MYLAENKLKFLCIEELDVKESRFFSKEFFQNFGIIFPKVWKIGKIWTVTF